MRLCRFEHAGRIRCGLYSADSVVPLDDLASISGEKLLADVLFDGHTERLFPIDSPAWSVTQRMATDPMLADARKQFRMNLSDVRLLPPIAMPPKLLMLAGNYNKHVAEQGGAEAERETTFPYVFMKPPSTTLCGSGDTFRLPKAMDSESTAEKLDHEIELGVVIGKQARDVSAGTALSHVAGYTIINDISDRGFRANPSRTDRPKDSFFDWLHGKWHDNSCPCGPCLLTADEVDDPNKLELQLTIDGDLRQQGNTLEQTFSVAEVIAFLSSWVTLEPGDIISTGTPAGVGNASGKFLQPGQAVCCKIEPIGELVTEIR
ncbi:MAG: fumarylacetoacetate hydrolase family protein [Aureliella sp.]